MLALKTNRQCRDFSRCLADKESRGLMRESLNDISNMRRTGQMDHDYSVRALFEELVPDGHEALRAMETNRRTGGGVFMEAGGDAVSTATFSNIIGQITYGDVLARFDEPDLIAGNLMTTRPAITQQQEIVAGITMIGDVAQGIGENEEYPVVGVGEQWIVMPSMIKNGFMLPITEEALIEDKTGQLMEQANGATNSLAINQEKERLNMILGTGSNSFRWKDNAAQATYGNTHTGFTLDNISASTALIDFTDIDAVKNLFQEMSDPNTGEPIVITGEMDIIVPEALETTLARIINATEVRVGAVAAGVPLTISGNPLQFGSRRYSPITSPYVSNLTGDTTTWYVGKFKEAFEDREIWPLQLFVEDRNSHMAFSRDWVTRIKVRRKSAPGVRAPWKVVQCTA